jgi:aspartate kinase
MKVFKFGGASVKDAEAVRNVADIINLYAENLVIVVSAMGKTTNAMEEIVEAYFSNDKIKTKGLISNVIDFHNNIIRTLGLPKLESIETIFNNLNQKVSQTPTTNFDYEYDQVVSFGEVMSTTIISEYLNSIDKNCKWFDARKIIRTGNKHREAKVDWECTKENVFSNIDAYFSVRGHQKIAITQGFIGHNEKGKTTTLGREGSDFSASILAWCLNAEEVIIWKDVAGVLNADPKYFDACKKLNKISFREAIELSYFGASVIHPKTIKPLQNLGIPLFVKCFLNPKEAGTEIQSSLENDTLIPSFIFKQNQILISISPKDFSFIAEDNLSEIFEHLSKNGIKINLMQNSAISFSICVDNNSSRINKTINLLSGNYTVKYNDGLELLTIRHYDDKTIQKLTTNKEVLVEQKSRHTARFVMKIH